MTRRRIIWPLLLAAALTCVLFGARRTAARTDADAAPTGGSHRFGIPPTRVSPGFAVSDSTVRPPPAAGGPSSKAPSRARDDTEDDANQHRQDAKPPPFKAAPPSLEDDDGEDGVSLKPAPEARDDEDEDKDDLDDHDEADDADEADGD